MHLCLKNLCLKMFTANIFSIFGNTYVKEHEIKRIPALIKALCIGI